MGGRPPLLWFPILVLASPQFRMQELLWGQTATSAEVKAPPVHFPDHYRSTPVGNSCLPSF